MLFISNKKREQISLVLSWFSPAQNIKAMTEGLLVYWFLVQNYAWLYTVQTLKWDTWKEIVQSQPFLKPKIFKIFCKQTDKIHSSTMCPLKTLKAFELTWPLRKQPSNLWILWVPLQKTWESFVFRKCCDWTMFFQVSQFEYLYCKETNTLLLNKI